MMRFDVTITFSEDVNNFLVGDITLRGTATYTQSLAGSGAGYTLTITPTVSGTVTITVPANKATDDAGNQNTAASTTETVNVDVAVPTVTISGLPMGEENDAFDVTITFSEDVTGFTKDDITVTGEATATSVSGRDASYTATITPNANKEGDVTLQVNASGVVDIGGNNNTASSVTSPIHIDTIVPTISFSGIPNSPQNAAFDVAVTFSENVMGFLVGDILFGGTATYTRSLTGSDAEYTLRITPTGSGTVTIQVPAN